MDMYACTQAWTCTQQSPSSVFSVEVRDSLCLQCHESSSANEIDKNGTACKVAHSSIQLLLVLVRHLYVRGQEEKGCTGQLL